MKRATFLATVTASVLAASASAQTSTGSWGPVKTQLSGHVVRSSTRRVIDVHDANGPVPGAEIWDIMAAGSPGVKLGETSGSGVLSLAGLLSRNDTSAILVRKIGYQEKSGLVMTGADDTLPFEFSINHLATQLPAVVSEKDAPSHLSMNMQGFVERANNNALRGSFIGPAELRTKWAGMDLSVVLPARGMVPELYNHGPAGPLTAKQHCKVVTYVNGIPGSPPSTSADAYQAIEFYPSAMTAPPEYVGTSGNICGIFGYWLVGS